MEAANYNDQLVENYHALNDVDSTNFDLTADLHRDTPSSGRHLPYSSMHFPLQDGIYQVKEGIVHGVVHGDSMQE